MLNTIMTMNLVQRAQSQDTKTWSKVFLMPDSHFMSLSNDKKDIKAYVNIINFQQASVEVEGRNKYGKKIIKKVTVVAYENIVNSSITRLLAMVANDRSK